MPETTTALVIGAGQAGVAMSEHLGHANIPHLVLERDRIAESWRTRRWDSLVANGPAWHDRFPNMTFPGTPPDDFVPKDQVASYFEAYAKKLGAPIRCGVTVTQLRRNIMGQPGFIAETSAGAIAAHYVIVATGAFQRPVTPALIPENAGPLQIHSNAYRRPAQLPEGAVLVVGGGSSGVQIADELRRAGRRVYLSVGAHHRPPRRYRGRDFVWWLGVLNKWDAEAPPSAAHVTIAVTGAHGGHTVDFRRLAAAGITLLGRTDSYQDGTLNIAPDLPENLAKGDQNYLSLLDEADAYIARNGLPLPQEPSARDIPANPPCVTNPIRQLNLAQAGITSVIWATGYARDDSWLKLDTFNEAGTPRHQRGVAAEPGLYFLGLPWQSRRGSSFIWGVWHDAKFLADHITRQRAYLAHGGPAPAVSNHAHDDGL